MDTSKKFNKLNKNFFNLLELVEEILIEDKKLHFVSRITEVDYTVYPNSGTVVIQTDTEENHSIQLSAYGVIIFSDIHGIFQLTDKIRKSDYLRSSEHRKLLASETRVRQNTRTLLKDFPSNPRTTTKDNSVNFKFVIQREICEKIYLTSKNT